jgi:para-aminobenzoate synthetase/4-amino-4-deoxychorismate lyase
LFAGECEYREVSSLSALAALPLEGRWTVAALDYELGYLVEPTAAPEDWRPARPLARFWQFRDCRVMTRAEADDWLAAQTGSAAAGIGDLSSAWSEKSYFPAVDRIRDYIFSGDCYQVNLTFPLEFSWFGNPLALYARLRARQPVRYGGFVGDDRQGIVSLSPELFVEKQGEHLLTRPMKGTAPRAADPAVLADSAKDRAENLMIVDLLRSDLGRIAENGSVAVEHLFAIEDYPSVWQMVSDVTARAPGVSFIDLLRALFPCGSITGAPKVRAMQIAAELEEEPRGLYTGALGWIAPNGDCRLNVAIRTLELAADGRGRLGIGSGIVADSLPFDEWHECLLKARFLRDLDPGLQLIETLRCEDGVFPRLDGHLARLQRSAAWFGFPFDAAAVHDELAAVPADGLYRVRLTLNKAGELAVEFFPLLDIFGTSLARWATTPIDAGDPLRRHKTTSRAMYDAALGELPADGSVFDVVFLNQRGEVAEGARSNVLVRRDGVLLTPPLSSGALPGVLRAELLASGRAREAVLWPADLDEGFFLGNALRGLLPVKFEAKKTAPQGR